MKRAPRKYSRKDDAQADLAMTGQPGAALTGGTGTRGGGSGTRGKKKRLSAGSNYSNDGPDPSRTVVASNPFDDDQPIPLSHQHQIHQHPPPPHHPHHHPLHMSGGYMPPRSLPGPTHQHYTTGSGANVGGTTMDQQPDVPHQNHHMHPQHHAHPHHHPHQTYGGPPLLRPPQMYGPSPGSYGNPSPMNTIQPSYGMSPSPPSSSQMLPPPLPTQQQMMPPGPPHHHHSGTMPPQQQLPPHMTPSQGAPIVTNQHHVPPPTQQQQPQQYVGQQHQQQGLPPSQPPPPAPNQIVAYCFECRNPIYPNDPHIPCRAGCQNIYHRLCSGLTELACDLLLSEPAAEWACNHCIRSNRQIPYTRPYSQHQEMDNRQLVIK